MEPRNTNQWIRPPGVHAPDSPKQKISFQEETDGDKPPLIQRERRTTSGK